MKEIYIEYTTTGGRGHGLGFVQWSKEAVEGGRSKGEWVSLVRVHTRRVTDRPGGGGMDFITYTIAGHGGDGANFIYFEGIFLEYTTTGGRGHGVGFSCWKNYLLRET